MKIAIIGLGGIGKEYLKILKKIDKVKEIYLVDINPINTKSNKKIKFISNVNFFKKLPNISHAFICTPSHLHYNASLLLLKNNINVLIEKPFVLKSTQSKNLINISMKNRNKCWVMFQNRSNSTIKKLSKLISSNYFGKTETIIAKLIWNRDSKYYSDGWHGKYKYDGGVLVNQAIHLIDVIIYLYGEIDKFTGFISFNKNKLEAEDLANLVFKTKKNIPISLIATTRASKDFEMSLDIIGSKRRVKIEGIALNKIFIENDKKKVINKYSFNTKVGHGINHNLIINEFLNKGNLDKFNLEISKNSHLIKLLNSIYNNLIDFNGFKISNKDSILG